MRIGIITFWQSQDNYGQLLQCWALQQALKQVGHNPFLIRYKGGMNRKDNTGLLSKIIRVCFNFRKYYLLWKTNQQYQRYLNDVDNSRRQFDKFRTENIELSSDEYDPIQLSENPPEADAYICGSDQIWGDDANYYLQFVPKGKIKIAYAVSLGTDLSKKTEQDRQWMKSCIHDFNVLGMRELEGVKACERIGVLGAKQVVDPTMLLEISNYDRIRKPCGRTDRFLLLYLIGNPTDMKVDEVYQYANEQKLEVVYVAVQGQLDNYPKSYPEIGQWIDLIARAELVITNSFHGTIFSLLYNTRFVTIPLIKQLSSKNKRIENILEQVHLQHRIYQNSLVKCASSSCSFLTFNIFCNKSKTEAFSFLNNALKN